VSTQTRVRATFVPVHGKLVLIEAFWPKEGTPDGRMPYELRRAYRELLGGLQLNNPPHRA
jgi:hypothetical protein